MTEFIKPKEILDIDVSSIKENTEILSLLEEAAQKVGEVKSVLSNVLEFDFINVAIRNIEALNSARIEGTTGNLQDLYMEESLDFEKKKRLKLFSAINYQSSVNELEEIVSRYKKLDIPLIRHLHKLLTEHDPATTGTPGKFRSNEVKISNSKLGDFYLVAPLHIDEAMNGLVSACEKNSSLPRLLQAAITHFQFESIHPFEDGNGRTGRLLIIAQLLINGMLDSLIINLSQFFDSNRDAYIAALRAVSDKADYTEWVTFFLRAVVEQCNHNIELIKKLRELREGNELSINENLQSPLAHMVLVHSLNKLYITTKDTETFLKQKHVKGDVAQTARDNILRLVKLGILEKTKFKRGRLEFYCHTGLQKLLQGSN